MNSRTTLNIHDSILVELKKISNNVNVPFNDLITLILQYASSDHKKKVRIKPSVEYQDTDVKEFWNCVHVSFDMELHHLCHQMRLFYMMSISKILAVIVTEYLDQIIDQIINKNLDNYENIYWKFSSKMKNGKTIFAYTWKKQRRRLKKPPRRK